MAGNGILSSIISIRVGIRRAGVGAASAVASPERFVYRSTSLST